MTKDQALMLLTLKEEQSDGDEKIALKIAIDSITEKRAHWIPYDKTGTNNFDDYLCSNCISISSYKSKFCSECGADMRENL